MMSITRFSLLGITAALLLYAPTVAAATDVTVSYRSDASVIEFTGQGAMWTSVAVIIVLGLFVQGPSHRVTRLIFTWLSALFACFYAAMIQAVPRWGAYGRSSPLSDGPAGTAILITFLLCIAFAIYATIMARKDYEPVFRLSLGPIPFAAVVAILFGAKEFMFTEHVLRNGGQYPIALLWLAPVLLLGCLLVARRNAFAPPESLPPSGADPETLGDHTRISDRMCPVCGTALSQLQVEIMIGNPQYQQWCREGYCSFKCFNARIMPAPNQALDSPLAPAQGTAFLGEAERSGTGDVKKDDDRRSTASPADHEAGVRQRTGASTEADSLKTIGLAEKSEAPEVGPPCVSCGKRTPEGSAICPSCGWTQPR